MISSMVVPGGAYIHNLFNALKSCSIATSVESWNKTLHIEAWDDPMEPMDKIPLLPY